MTNQTPNNIQRVFASSPWVEEKCRINSQWLEQGLAEDFARVYELGTYQQQLAEFKSLDFVQLAKHLRQFRNRALVRIIWRMSLRWANLEETIADLSALADTIILFAEQQLFTWLSEKYGVPQNEQGEPEHLVVVALGKLGGQELNLSSDIDLLFAYADEGLLTTSGLTYAEFYQRLSQQLIKLLNEVTADGFVFRVDMRLRPYGDSGPLAMSFPSLENYYQANGREWERYALIKARPITGNAFAQQEFINLIRPFVYRRYVDYSVMQSLREMHAMIQQEVQRKGLQDHVKLGAGGIRSIEFIVQMHQLMRGGRDTHLQQIHFFSALHALQEAHILEEAVAENLRQAYIFLRETEHALQAVHDQQTHELPQLPTERERLANTLNFKDWQSFLQQLNMHRQHVQEYFAVYSTPPEVRELEKDQELTTNKIAQLWQAEIEEDEALKLLQDMGFKQAQSIYNLLREYADSPQCQHLTSQASHRLLAFIPALLQQVADKPDPELILSRMLEITMSVVKRSAYLVLLLENPAALQRIIMLCAASSWLAQELVHHPALLDELLSAHLLKRIPTRASILQELQHALAKISVSDVEQQLDVLRYIKRVNFLRVAAAELNNLLTATKASRALTTIAEAIIHMVFILVWRQQIKSSDNNVLLEQTLTSDFNLTKRIPFIIVAYGKLASRELSYTSDLDCVFLFEPCDLTAWGLSQNSDEVFLRVAKRMMHWLNTPTHMGVLFRIDTQLQPEGSAGLLVSDWQRFVGYQHEHAWIWEQQALVRSRLILGSLRWHRQFKYLRNHILSEPRTQPDLAHEIVAMRQRMQQYTKGTGGKDTFDLKKDPGGMIDIEFIVQYGVLLAAAQHPKLLKDLDISHLCNDLAKAGLLTSQQASSLKGAYRVYQERAHLLALQNLPAAVSSAEYQSLRTGVRKVWEEIME